MRAFRKVYELLWLSDVHRGVAGGAIAPQKYVQLSLAYK